MRLIFFLSALFGSFFLTGCRDALPTSKGPNLEIYTHLDLPSKGAYTGAYIDFGDSEDDVSLERLDEFEDLVGKHQAIIASSSFWGEQTFPMKNLTIIAHYGAVPLVYWSPWDKPYEQNRKPDRFNLNAIVDGKWDTYIDAWANSAKEYKRPLFVAWGLEMNGTWFPWSGSFYGSNKPADSNKITKWAGPELYKKAYRYVVDRVRKQGASNILWVFHTNNYSYPNEDWNGMKAYYPGSEYVDFLGMSAYGKQFKNEDWVTATDTFSYPYEELAALDPDKPLMLAEWGIGEFEKSGNKAGWIRDALALLSTKYPRLKAIVFWNERWENSDGSISNLRVTSSPEAFKAYREGIANPFWIGTPLLR